MVPFFCCSNYATVFVVLSVIIAHCSLNIINSNGIDAQRPVKENGRLPYVGMGGSPTPLAKLQDLLNGTLSHYRGIRLPNAVQDFCQ